MMMMICLMASTIMMANNGDGDVSLIDYPHDMRMNGMMMMICLMASTIMMANNGDGDVSLIDYPHDMRMSVMRRKISMRYMDSSSTLGHYE